jgi:hypothetical protein
VDTAIQALFGYGYDMQVIISESWKREKKRRPPGNKANIQSRDAHRIHNSNLNAEHVQF